MSLPYDASMKFLIEKHPEAVLALAGLSGDSFEIIEADLSTVTSAADKLIKVKRKGKQDFIHHVEVQSS